MANYSDFINIRTEVVVSWGYVPGLDKGEVIIDIIRIRDSSIERIQVADGLNGENRERALVQTYDALCYIIGIKK